MHASWMGGQKILAFTRAFPAIVAPMNSQRASGSARSRCRTGRRARSARQPAGRCPRSRACFSRQAISHLSPCHKSPPPVFGPSPHPCTRNIW